MLEALIKKAAFAWDPIGQIRDRLASGELNLGSIWLVCVGVIIASNVASIASRKVFFDSLTKITGEKYGDHPVLSSKIGQEFLTVLFVVPIAPLALLPQSLFDPATRSVVLSSLLIVLASVGFYSSIITIIVNMLASFGTMVSIRRGMWILTVGNGVAGVATLVYLVVIWIRASSVIGLSIGSSAILMAAFFAAVALVMLFLVGLTRRSSRLV